VKELQREAIAITKKAGVYKGCKPSLTLDRVAELRARAASGEKKADLGGSILSLATILSMTYTTPNLNHVPKHSNCVAESVNSHPGIV
jgi:hypothetical protein